MHGGRGDGHAERQMDVPFICTMYVKKQEVFRLVSQPADFTRLRGTGCAWVAGIDMSFLLTWHGIVSHGRAA
jgi:hypothetical protein